MCTNRINPPPPIENTACHMFHKTLNLQAVVTTVMNFWVSQNAWNLANLAAISFSRRLPFELFVA